MADTPPYPGAPRWVKVLGIIATVLVLLFLVLKVTGIGGHHGPGRHTPPGHAQGNTPSPSATEDPAPAEDGVDGHSPPEDVH